jgi:hypothetical protein
MELKRHDITLIALLSLVGLFLAVLMMVGPTLGTITGDTPPALGDWVIDNPTTVSDETVIIEGNITVNDVLTLRNANIVMLLWSTGEYEVVVKVGGSMSATNTAFKANNSTHKYNFEVEGKMDLTGTTVEDAIGVRILTTDTVTITNCKILNFTKRGLYLEDADGTTVDDCLITTNDYDGISWNHIDPLPPYETTYYYGLAGAVVYIKGGSPTVNDIKVSVNGSITVYNDINKVYDYAYNTVNLNFPMVGIESKGGAQVSDISVLNSTISPVIYNRIFNNYTGTNYQYANVYTNFYPSAIMVRNYQDLTLGGASMENLEFEYAWVYTDVYGNYLNYVYAMSSTYSPKLFLALVDETVKTEGPHEYKVTLKDTSFEDTSIFNSMFGPDYEGSGEPVFNLSIVVDNVTVLGGSNLFGFDSSPLVDGMKYVNAVMRISNSSFTNVSDVIVGYQSFPGPGSASDHRITMNETFIFENNDVINCDAGVDSLITISSSGGGIGDRGVGGANDVFEEWHIVRNNTFKDNYGTVIWYYGSYTKSIGHRRAIVEDNEFIGNWCNQYDVFLYFFSFDIVRLNNNLFKDNIYQEAVYLYDYAKSPVPGQSSHFLVMGNTFINNTLTGSYYNDGFFYCYFGGYIEFSHNNITQQEGINFITIFEYTYYTGFAKFSFHHNEITNVNSTVLYFYGYYNYHPFLTAFIHNNKLWDNNGEFVNYYGYEYYMTNYDYDATIFFENNTIVRSAGRVFTNYGDLTIVNNTFIDCEGPVVVLEYLNLHSPKITENTIIDCKDVYVIGAKRRGMLNMLLEVENLYVDCTGVAFRFNDADVTMKNVTVTKNAAIAIVADEANVDAIDSLIPSGSGQVIGSGSINVWFNIEMWILWADAQEVTHGGKVSEALVVFHGVTGTYYTSDYCDEFGHLQASQILQWSMTGPYTNLWSPYKITVAKNGISTATEVELDRSFKGDDALILKLVDPYMPFAQIVSPFKDSLVATETMGVRGFATDVGSGIDHINVTINDMSPVTLTVDERGDFEELLTEVPEGPLTLTLAVVDIAGNTFESEINIVVDRTPPRLVIISPTEGDVTNQSAILIRGDVEPGASVVINEFEIPDTTGVLSTMFELSEGLNVLIIEATDPAGNKASIVLNVTLDRLLPILSLASPRDMLITQQTNVTLVGNVEEGAEITVSVFTDTTDLIDEAITPGEEGSFSHGVDLSEGRNVIVVRSRDAGQNWAIITRIVYVDTTPPECAITSPADGDITNSETVRVMGWAEVEGVLLYLDGKQIHNTGTVDRMVRLHEGSNDIELRAVDAIGNEYTHSIMVTLDTHPPVIVMTSPLEDSVMISSPMLRLVGRVMGDANTLTVDGMNVVLGADGSFDTTVTIPTQGLSEVEIIATDLAGNFVIKTLQVDLRTEKPMLVVTYFPAEIPIKNKEGNLYIYGTTLSLVSEVVVTHTTDSGTITDTYLISEDGTFTIVLSLEEGSNEVTLSVVDPYGNTNESEVYSVDYVMTKPDQAEDDAVTFAPQDAGIIILVIAMTLFATAVVVTRNFRAQRS